MKKEKVGGKRHFKLEQKQIALIGIVISIPLIISAYVYCGVGLEPSSAQTDAMLVHIHPELSIMMDDKPLSVPSNIGIDSSLWNDNSLDEYGMQAIPEMRMSGMAPLHTHDDSGVVHVESSINRNIP